MLLRLTPPTGSTFRKVRETSVEKVSLLFILKEHYHYPASRGQMTPTSQAAIEMGICGHFEAWVRKQEAVDV